MPQVIVNISAEGEVEVSAHGVKGAGCQALTKAIEEAIGETTADRKTPEFHQTAAAGQGQKATQS